MSALAQIVYTQNGNQHDEITALIESARALLAAPAPMQQAAGQGDTDRDLRMRFIAIITASTSLSEGAVYGLADQLLALAQSAPQSSARDQALEALLTCIDDANEAYEHYGSICEFEGNPMIYAATLTEIVTLRGEYHAASLKSQPASQVSADVANQAINAALSDVSGQDKQDAELWKAFAEMYYGKLAYPDQLELAQGALDAYFRKIKREGGIEVLRAILAAPVTRSAG